MSVGTPARCPMSISAFLTQSCSVCGVQPILAAIDVTAAQRDGCSLASSRTIRTARARTSGENLFVVLLVMAPSSQELEPPANPGRFKTGLIKLLGTDGAACFVIARAGLIPGFYEELIRNVGTIDATTRHHIA